MERHPRLRRGLPSFTAGLVITTLILTASMLPLGPLPSLGALLNPATGIYSAAAISTYPERLSIASKELTAPVTVVRDRWGVPHIYGETFGDRAFAQGYMHASDRLWQMDVQRRFASGRLAELLGPSWVQQDRWMRIIGLRSAAERTWTALTATDLEFADILRRYAAGVNHFLQATSSLPLEFHLLGYRPDPWDPVDSLVIGKLMGWILSGDLDDLKMKLTWDRLGVDAVRELFLVERLRQIPIVPDEALAGAGPPRTPFAELDDIKVDLTDAIREILGLAGEEIDVLGLRASYASNNWVVDGTKSASGKPMLANDPHLQLTLPSIWYEVHLSGGRVDVYGVSIPGTGGVVLGHNRFIAWGFTNVGADVTDFYVELINPANSDQYWYDGKWRSFTTRTEIIRVRAGTDIEVKVRESVHGPVLNSRGPPIAMQWTGSDATFEGRALFRLAQARNYAEFLVAVRDFAAPAQNIVYADVEGNIALWVTGWFPIRKNGIGLLPHNGSTGAFEWTGFIPFDELPHAVNPSQHFLASANQKSTSNRYPYYLGTLGWDPGYRARRINHLLASAERVSFADMKRFQADTTDLLAQSFLPHFLHALQGRPGASGLIEQAVSILRGWDHVARTDAVAPTIWWNWLQRFYDHVFADEWAAVKLPLLLRPHPDIVEAWLEAGDSCWFDDVRTPGRESLGDVVETSLRAALEELRAELGNEIASWRWGRWHQLDLRHPSEVAALSHPPTPREGNGFTLNVAWGQRVRAGPSWRMVVDLATPGDAVGVIPGGQSGHPASPHYRDQLLLWLANDYHRLLMPATISQFPDMEIESILEFHPA